MLLSDNWRYKSILSLLQVEEQERKVWPLEKLRGEGGRRERVEKTE